MDPRLYILAGTFLLLVVSFAYLAIAAARSRREREAASEVLARLAHEETDGEIQADGDIAEIEWPMEGESATHDALSTPLRIGDWRPGTAPAEASKGYAGPRAQPVAEEPSSRSPEPSAEEPPSRSLEPSPEEPEREPAEQDVEHVLDTLPDVSPEPTVVAEVERAIEASEAPEVEPAPAAPLEAPTVAAPETGQEPPQELLQGPSSLPETREIVEPDVPGPGPLPESEPAIPPEVLPELEPASEVVPEVEPEPAEIAVAPEPEPEPVESVLPPEPEPEAAESVLPPEPEPPSAESVLPPEPLSADAPPAPPVAASIDDSWLDEVMPGAAVSEAPPAPDPAPERDAPEFDLVSPVEMWFGDTRVGVKEGTKTYELFQRYASALLNDLSEARKSS